MFYSKSTGGFYAAEIHGARHIERVTVDPDTGETLARSMEPNPYCKIPPDAVEITDAHHADLLAEQSSGKMIAPDAAGQPVAVDPPPPTKEQRKTAIERQLEQDLVAGVIFNGSKYHTDDRFVSELMGLVMSHQTGMASGVESIRTMDNQIVQLNVNELIALGAAVGDRRKALYQAAWAEKDAL